MRNMETNKIENQNNNTNTKKRGLAVASLVFGIIGGCSAFSTASIVAIICGHLALHKIKKDPNLYTGKGLAKVGLILGYLGFALEVALGIMRGVVINKLNGLGF